MTQFNSSSTYQIDRPSGQCAFTGVTMTPGDRYMATLVEHEVVDDKGASQWVLKRADISMEAWERGDRPERLFSYWKGVVPEPNEKKKLFVDDEVLVNLFRRLEEDEAADRVAFRFVLALILMRKKMLKYEGMESDEQSREWWVMAHKAAAKHNPEPDAERTRVLNPRLDEDQIQQVTSQLGEVLQAEL